MMAKPLTKSTQQQAFTLLSPELPAAEPYAEHCITMTFSLTFITSSASFEVLQLDNSSDSSLMWGVAGLINKLKNAVAYIDLSMDVRRFKMVAKLSKNDKFTIESIDVDEGVCAELYNETKLGNFLHI